jgi:hypothetical protein
MYIKKYMKKKKAMAKIPALGGKPAMCQKNVNE